jgi:uncharacterized protein YpmS
MAINTSNIQFNESKSAQTTWPKGFLILTIVLLCCIIVSVFVIQFLSKQNSQALAQLDKDIEVETQAFSSDTSNELVNFQNELSNIQIILKNHTWFSSALTKIATNTLSQVTFDTLNINYNTKQVEIQGKAQNNEMVAQATYLFSRMEGIKQANLKNVKNDTSGVSFVIVLDVKDDFFK